MTKSKTKSPAKSVAKSNSERKSEKLRVLWSIDAFEEKSGTRAHVVGLLKKLAADHPIEIEPVYVLSPDELDVSTSFSDPWIRRFQPSVEKAIDALVKESGLENVLPARILVVKKPSQSQAVQILTNYAKRSGADLIAIGTHGRRGLSRVFMGSFAESVLLKSTVPVLVVGPHTKVHELQSILFATDLSPRSARLFDRVVRLAAALGSKLTLFHAVPHPMEPVFESGLYMLGGGWVQVPEFLDEREDKTREQLKAWATRARKAGVEAEILIDRSHAGISDSILRGASRGKVGMIAMAAQSGPVASALMGSITRQVVREAGCPVWVLRA